MILIILVAALTATLLLRQFYYSVIKQYDYWKDMGVKQGKPLWLVGDSWGTLFRLQSMAEMVSYFYNQCPGTRYSGIYQFLTPTLVVKDPDLLKHVTVKDFDHFVDHRTFIPDNIDRLMGKNLFALKGQKWRVMRAVLSPSFTSSKMKSMFVLISECAENFVEYFLDKDEDMVTMEMKDVLSRFTNDVIGTAAFGIKVDSLREPENEFYMMGKSLTNFTTFRRKLKFFGCFLCPKLFSFFRIGFFSQKESDFFLGLMNMTIKTREEQGIVRHDMIHLLLEARKGDRKNEDNNIADTEFATAEESELIKETRKIQREITNEDIASQALVFFLAGFDAVANMLAFATYELAVNPDVQKRLRQEVLATLEECKGKVTYEGLIKMKYMDMVVSEVMRKWPIAVAADRVCTKPYTIEPTTPEEEAIHLKKGAILLLPIFGIHRDPKNYPDPERFDPERFSDENKGKVNPYTYLPFGLGPRGCIGLRFALLEAKALLFNILTNFELIPIEKTPIPLKISKKKFSTTAEGGIWLGMKHIK